MVEYGPIQLLAVGFPEADKLKGELLKEIFRLSEEGMIRVIGLLAIVKDKQGKVASAQITEFSDQERMKLGAAIGARAGVRVPPDAGGTGARRAGVAVDDIGLLGLVRQGVDDMEDAGAFSVYGGDGVTAFGLEPGARVGRFG